jgi:hypothetical protein
MSKTFAVLSGNVVSNVIIAETKEDAELVSDGLCVEYTSENPAGINYTHDSETGLFSAPVEEQPEESIAG